MRPTAVGFLFIMGKCCSKPPKEEEERIPFKFTVPNSKEDLDKMESGEGDTLSNSKSSVNTRRKGSKGTFDDNLKENTLLLRSGKGDQAARFKMISTVKDFVIGKYFDKENDLWFRSIYVLETDSMRKQFLSMNSLDMRKFDKDQFENWCDKNGFPDTKTYYDNFKLLDYMPLNRMLSGLAHKYEVKIYLSDLFTFKGRGPYRAVTCYGHQSALIDRALNEYETRLGKAVTIPHLTKQWDNYVFPDPLVDIADHSSDITFKWPRRIRPNPPFVPYWPYKLDKNCPLRLKKYLDDVSVEPRNKNSGNSDYILSSHLSKSLGWDSEKIDSHNVNTGTLTKITPGTLKKFFESGN